MLRYENEDENEDYYKRQQGTTKNNFIEPDTCFRYVVDYLSS